MPAVLLFAGGILFQQLFNLPFTVTGIGLIVSTVLLWTSKREVFTRVLVVALLMGGMARIGFSGLIQGEKAAVFGTLHNERVELIGEVAEVRIFEQSVRILLSIRNGAIHVYFDNHPGFSVGDKVTLSGQFQELKRPRNPGVFDYRSYYHRRDIWGSLYDPEVTKFEASSSWNMNIFFSRSREVVSDLFRDIIGGNAGALMSALIVGLREEIPNVIRQDFADTGVIHVLAVSGLHVGYVLIIILALVKIVRLPYRWQKWAVIFCLVLYALLTGGKPSVWRATLMASFYLLAKIVQRDGNLWNIIACTALVLLIINPYYIFDLGFQLSFAAVISIVFFYGYLEQSLPQRFRPSLIENDLLKGVSGLLLVSLSAQVGTLPFIWGFFGRIPIMGIFANVLIVPLVGVVVSIGFALLFFGWVPVVGVAFGQAAWFISKIIFLIANLFAKIPFSSIELGTPEPIQLLQYGAVVITVVMLMRKELWHKAALAGMVATNLFVWSWALERKVVDIIFMDVGQGDGAVVRISTDEGKRTILIDAGPLVFTSDAGEKVVVPVLKHLGTRKIDLLIMSHPHADHIGGASAVMDAFSVNEVWDTFTSYESSLYGRIVSQIDERDITYRRSGTGFSSDQFSPVYFTVLHPDSAWAVTERNVNNASVVVKMTYGETSFLFVGDLEREGDREILAYSHMLNVDVLKVGHHGSITSSTQPLIEAVTPDIAVVSVGEKNKFKHPSSEVISRLKGSDVKILRTDVEGAIWLKTNGRRIWRYGWR